MHVDFALFQLSWIPKVWSGRSLGGQGTVRPLVFLPKGSGRSLGGQATIRALVVLPKGPGRSLGGQDTVKPLVV